MGDTWFHNIEDCLFHVRVLSQEKSAGQCERDIVEMEFLDGPLQYQRGVFFIDKAGEVD